jgi:hypothetical protein
MLTDFTLTDADAGRDLGVPDSFLVNLTMVTPPVWEQPDFDPGKQRYTAGFFVLRGSKAFRDSICVGPSANGGAFQHWGSDANMLINSSIGYRGSLIVMAVPKGSTWKLTLSDVPNVRTADAHMAA